MGGPSVTIRNNESKVFSASRVLTLVLINLSCEKVLSTSAVCIGITRQIFPRVLMFEKNRRCKWVGTKIIDHFAMLKLTAVVFKMFPIARPFLDTIFRMTNNSTKLFSKIFNL